MCPSKRFYFLQKYKDAVQQTHSTVGKAYEKKKCTYAHRQINSLEYS